MAIEGSKTKTATWRRHVKGGLPVSVKHFGAVGDGATDDTSAFSKAAAEGKIVEINESGKWRNPVVTQVAEAAKFWRAEEYHQRYLEKNGGGFCNL